jgi:hypothetical protein
MARNRKFTYVAEKLKVQVDAGVYPVGEPLPPEHKLAEEYGVNRLTLRKALDVLSREQVVIRRPRCGTFPNPVAVRQKIDAVMYVGDTSAHFYDGFYQTLCGEAQNRGLAILTVKPDADDPVWCEQFRALASRHQRLICMQTYWPQVKSFIGAGIHATRVSGFQSVGDLAEDERPGYVVSTDQYRAFKLAVEYLVKLGHRKIGLLDLAWAKTDDSLVAHISPRRDSVLGYRAALQENGLGEEWVMGIPDRYDVKDRQEFEEQSIRHHFDLWPTMPTAILSTSDFRVVPLLRVLRERGLRVPEDMSVVGMGNTPWTLAVDPPLTSVCLGEKELASLALMLNAEREPETARVVRVDPELVVRKSTAAIV